MGRMDRMKEGRWEKRELHLDERDESFAPAGAIWEEDGVVRWRPGTTGCAAPGVRRACSTAWLQPGVPLGREGRSAEG